MTWMIYAFTFSSFGAYATQNGYAFSMNFNVLKRENYVLNMGFTNYNYMGIQRNFLNMDFRMKWKSLEIRVIGNFPVNTNLRNQFITR